MYEIADQVAGWTSAGLPVQLARVIELAGVSSRDRAAAVAHSPGQPLAGTLLGGAADPQLIRLLEAHAGSGTDWLTVSDEDAAGAGLSCGGRVRLLMQPAADVDWAAVLDQQPLCLVTDLAGERVGETRTYRLADLPQSGQPDQRLAEVARMARRGISETLLLHAPDQVVTTLWPTVRLLVVGDGLIADALAANAALLGWRFTASAALAEDDLRPSDNVVVLSHDLDVSGRALQAAIAAGCGYVGALGSRHTQAARASWLAEHGASAEQVGAIHGPAGLAIGSRTPAEIALSILAEIVQVRS